MTPFLPFKACVEYLLSLNNVNIVFCRILILHESVKSIVYSKFCIKLAYLLKPSENFNRNYEFLKGRIIV